MMVSKINSKNAYTDIYPIHNFDNKESALPQSLLDIINSRNGNVLYYSYGNYNNQMAGKTTLIIDLGRVQ